EDVGRLAGRRGGQPCAQGALGRWEDPRFLPAIPLAPLPLPRRKREVGSWLGDARDVFLRALGARRRERMRTPAVRQEPEVVPAGAATRYLERVPLHPGTRIERLVVRELGPTLDEVLRLFLHHRQLRSLALGRVPGQHHATDPLVALAVADHRDAGAARVLQLSEEVYLFDRPAELHPRS